MSKTGNFKRAANDKYRTPYEAIPPLLPWLTPGMTFIDPCAGDGRIGWHLNRHAVRCVQAFDTAPDDLFIPVADALTEPLRQADRIITNPPWTRKLLHPMIWRFMEHAPTWLLFDAAWMCTEQRGQVARLLDHCSHVVIVGRLRWFDGTPHKGQEDSAWYHFNTDHTDGPKIYPIGWNRHHV